MIKSKADLKFYLNEDKKRNGYAKLGYKYYLSLILGNEKAQALRYIMLMRHCEYHHAKKSNIFHLIAYAYYYFRYNRLGLRLKIRIPINTCGYGLRIMHLSGGGGILLNVKSVGNYCGFNSGVLLGNKDTQDDRPTIGNFVAFAPGSKAFGNITIGDNVFVAPNSVVTKDIPSNKVVGGIPAKVLKERTLADNKTYQKYHIINEQYEKNIVSD